MSPINFVQTRYAQLDIDRNNCAENLGDLVQKMSQAETKECILLLKAGEMKRLAIVIDDIPNEPYTYLSLWRGFHHSFLLAFVPAIYHHSRNFLLLFAKEINMALNYHKKLFLWLGKLAKSNPKPRHRIPKSIIPMIRKKAEQAALRHDQEGTLKKAERLISEKAKASCLTPLVVIFASSIFSCKDSINFSFCLISDS